jgi:hypothetical protein
MPSIWGCTGPCTPHGLTRVQFHPRGLKLGQFPLYVGWMLKPRFVTSVLACTVGQSVLMSSNLVTDQLQMLAGIIVDIVQMVH